MKKLRYVIGAIIITSVGVFTSIGVQKESTKSTPQNEVIQEPIDVSEVNEVYTSNLQSVFTENISQYGFDISEPGGLVRAVNAAVSAGEKNIFIPEGVFDCGGQKIVLNDYVTISGAGKDKTVLNNIGFECLGGISIHNMGLNSGIGKTINSPGGIKDDATVIVYINPKDSACKIEYIDCSFSNTDYASFISGTTKIESDYAYNCSFTDIGRVAIYHSINIGKSEYINNEFRNIGSENISNGAVSGIWIGDVTNVTKTQSDNVSIVNNTFSDMYTAYDTSLTSHIINANFISVRADVAIIDSNVISDVHGFGEDREGLYTKVRCLSVTNNIINNGGFGESYITCKAQDVPGTYTKIVGNTITGKYGGGISLYGPGLIENNTINITDSKIAIVCHSREFETTDKVEIYDNEINCEPGQYVLNGEVIKDYDSKNMLFADLAQSDMIIKGNTFKSDKTEGGWQSVIDIGCVERNITIENNTIDVKGNKTTGINIHATDEYSEYNKDKKYIVKYNKLYIRDLSLKMILKGNIETRRSINILNNSRLNSNEKQKSIFLEVGKNDEIVYNGKKDGYIQENKKVLSY